MNESVIHQSLNPYLPLWEHIPDGEPHIFGNRLYIYGSHDRSHGTTFCMDDYVCWSASVDDLSDWRCEGVIWHKTDDPDNRDPIGYLYAPDVVQGPDGRYYLYYFFTGSKRRKMSIRVAVCDEPAGQYKFYGVVDLEDDRFLPFDPSVLVDDDGRIWLYYGSAFQGPQDMLRIKGGAVVELAQDMKTVISKPKLTAPNTTHQRGTGFDGHAFFEASSIRKIGERYYFIYSSMLSHELCYAIAEKPDGPFVYGGTIISNGDVGLNGNRRPVYPTGNNHGSLVEINGQWYIFYHRQTQGRSFSRQGCAEKITILPDGSIPQVEITSCGLHEGALQAKGTYSAGYCCNLIATGKHGLCVDEEEAEREKIAYVRGMKNGDSLGYKYFAFQGRTSIRIVWRVSLAYAGMMQTMTLSSLHISGNLELCTTPDGPAETSISISGSAGDWENAETTMDLNGHHALYLRWRGKGSIDIREIQFS